MEKEIDLLSKYLSTVYKPIVLPSITVVLAILLDVATSGIIENYRLLSIICTSLAILYIIITYYICKTIGKKRNTLKVEKITNKKKVITLSIMLISLIILSLIISIMRALTVLNII